MNEIRETFITLQYNDGGTTRHDTTRLLYFLMYGWSPWNSAFIEEQGCQIVIANLGLHYHAVGESRGIHWYQPKLEDDIKAAITYLVDFESSQSNRIAVWR